MCGRFANNKPAGQLLKRFQAENSLVWDGSYNIAPTEFAPIAMEVSGHRTMELARFGIPMTGAKGRSFPLNNTQSEKAVGRKDFIERRCIVPATGFYEWIAVSPKDKQPVYFSPVIGMFVFAALWAKRDNIFSFSILTTQANEVVGAVHGRMPVILGHNSIGDWLASTTPVKDLGDFMKPCPDNLMKAQRVSKYVNKATNKGADCLNSA